MLRCVQQETNKKMRKTKKKTKKSRNRKNTDLQQSTNDRYLCIECFQNSDKVVGENDCLYNTDTEPWYLNELLSWPMPNFTNIFCKSSIQKNIESQCKEGMFSENCLEEIQRNLCCQKSTEEIIDPCNPPKKPKSVKSSNKKRCKCPPDKDSTVKTASTVKKCIGHSLIEDEVLQAKPRKKKSKNGNYGKQFACDSEPMTKWFSELAPSPDFDLGIVQACQDATERVICCTQINDDETDIFKARNTKKSKRKKITSKKLSCKCSKTNIETEY
ncbi:uncharacterized protein LOC130901524 [Diorhabda carinulata]|uniref:uncharacterized protein LOC130901524 n=1 Tax=Diorhabda carinulata TaxID=1163345 RepID=UPI0025A0D194|nr:uncharacterized protein LOC130901524 [Diorhabda carinulata]